MQIPENLLNYSATLIVLQEINNQSDMRLGRILKSVIDSGQTELHQTSHANTISWLKKLLEQHKSEYVLSILKAA